MAIGKTGETVEIVDEGSDLHGRQADVHRDDVTGQEYYRIEAHPTPDRWTQLTRTWQRFDNRVVRLGQAVIKNPGGELDGRQAEVLYDPFVCQQQYVVHDHPVAGKNFMLENSKFKREGDTLVRK